MKVKNFLRKCVALMLTLTALLSFNAVTAFAATAETATANDSVIKKSAKLVAYEQGYIQMDGEVSVYLDSTIWGGILECTCSGGGGNMVDISVQFPDGSVKLLDSAPSNGAYSSSKYFYHLPKGTYTFIFDGIDNFHALCCIYDK